MKLDGRTGHPEYYYFTDDNKYSWRIDSESEDFTDARIIESYGTWEIKDGNLIINELVQKYRDGGEFEIPSKEEQEENGYANLPYFVNSTLVTKKVNNIYTKELIFVKTVEYENGKYSNMYLLDNKVFYTNAGVDNDIESNKKQINDMLSQQ